jgi:acetyl-CoA C-acetyltransferase
MSNPRQPVILGGARTPQGRFLGALASLSAVDLGIHALR